MVNGVQSSNFVVLIGLSFPGLAPIKSRVRREAGDFWDERNLLLHLEDPFLTGTLLVPRSDQGKKKFDPLGCRREDESWAKLNLL